MVRVYDASKRRASREAILQITRRAHNRYPLDEVEVKKLLKDCMENVVRLSVPLIAEVETGKSWYDTK